MCQLRLCGKFIKDFVQFLFPVRPRSCVIRSMSFITEVAALERHMVHSFSAVSLIEIVRQTA